MNSMQLILKLQIVKRQNESKEKERDSFER